MWALLDACPRAIVRDGAGAGIAKRGEAQRKAENERGCADHECDVDDTVPGSHERGDEPQEESGKNRGINSQDEPSAGSCAGEIDCGDENSTDAEADEAHALSDFIDCVCCSDSCHIEVLKKASNDPQSSAAAHMV